MKTIENREQLKGMINLLIDQFSLNKRSIIPEVGLGFEIKENAIEFVVHFTWTAGYKLIFGDYFTPNDHRTIEQDDWFRIRKDDSLSKLEQYVEDCLFRVSETREEDLV